MQAPVDSPHLSTREDFRKRKELAEARKSGLAPAEKDEEGRDINPHIPQYIAKAPWYLSQGGDQSSATLKHQRHKEEAASSIDVWYRRGLVACEETPKKFRKGACANCGAMTHSTKGCTERPRKLGAKWTGVGLKQDEIVQEGEVKLNFEAKRDRWGGFESSDYDMIIDNFNTMNNDDDDPKLDQEEFDTQNAPVGTKDEHTRTTTRNLRIREDKAKYLLNLDTESAFYDPKTRSMRDDPLKGLIEAEDISSFRGDNQVRQTGEAKEIRNLERFSWEAYKHGVSVNVQANPTALMKMEKDHVQRKQDETQSQREKVLARYGGEEHLQLPASALLVDDESYVEIHDDQVTHVKKPVMAKSKYVEDEFLFGHTSVFGSYYDKEKKKWGYGCCHATDKLTPCLNA